MKLSQHNQVAKAEGLSAARYRGGVIVVHGMNTHAPWQLDLISAIQDAGLKYLPAHYGRIIFPVLLRRSPAKYAEIFLDKYEEMIRHNIEISAIGHSYGTRVIGTALEQHPDLRLKRIALFGGILPRKFNWKRLAAGRQVETVLNEACPRDRLPKIASFAVPESGSSGCCGFKDGLDFVHERAYPHTGHSGLATSLHCKGTWIPFLLDGKLPPGAGREPCTSWVCRFQVWRGR